MRKYTTLLQLQTLHIVFVLVCLVRYWLISLMGGHMTMTCLSGKDHGKKNYVDILSGILNLEEYLNRCISSKVTAILLNGWILPTGGVPSGRVCACSLGSRLVNRPGVAGAVL